MANLARNLVLVSLSLMTFACSGGAGPVPAFGSPQEDDQDAGGVRPSADAGAVLVDSGRPVVDDAGMAVEDAGIVNAAVDAGPPFDGGDPGTYGYGVYCGTDLPDPSSGCMPQGNLTCRSGETLVQCTNRGPDNSAPSNCRAESGWSCGGQVDAILAYCCPTNEADAGNVAYPSP